MGSESRTDEPISEWETGLPSTDDLTPLSQSLIPAELASAFKISPEPTRTLLDVNRASQSTLSSLRTSQSQSLFNFKPFSTHVDDHDDDDPKRTRPINGSDDCTTDDQSTGSKTLKRPRLVWTPQLHKRFVDVVAHLGLKNAVPKTIMQLMNVEGLTRENVASHLQKYRLYVKRMQGLSNEGPSPSDHLFASTPVPPQSFNESSSCNGNGNGNVNVNGSSNKISSSGGNNNNNNNVGMSIPMPYPPPQQMMPIPMMGMGGFHGYEAAHSHFQQQYSSMMQQQRDWSGKFNGYPHHTGQNTQ